MHGSVMHDGADSAEPVDRFIYRDLWAAITISRSNHDLTEVRMWSYQGRLPGRRVAERTPALLYVRWIGQVMGWGAAERVKAPG